MAPKRHRRVLWSRFMSKRDGGRAIGRLDMEWINETCRVCHGSDARQIWKKVAIVIQGGKVRNLEPRICPKKGGFDHQPLRIRHLAGKPPNVECCGEFPPEQSLQTKFSRWTDNFWIFNLLWEHIYATDICLDALAYTSNIKRFLKNWRPPISALR